MGEFSNNIACAEYAQTIAWLHFQVEDAVDWYALIQINRTAIQPSGRGENRPNETVANIRVWRISGVAGLPDDAAHPGIRTVNHAPPILQTIFHSSGVTGCTERREYFTSAMSANRLSALIAPSSPASSAARRP